MAAAEDNDAGALDRTDRERSQDSTHDSQQFASGSPRPEPRVGSDDASHVAVSTESATNGAQSYDGSPAGETEAPLRAEHVSPAAPPSVVTIICGAEGANEL